LLATKLFQCVGRSFLQLGSFVCAYRALPLGPAHCRLGVEPLSSWPGLSRPSTPAPPPRRVWHCHGPVQRPANARFFTAAGCLRALDAPNHVDGLDKPGHDALKDPPANLSRIPNSSPTANEIALVSVAAKIAYTTSCLSLHVLNLPELPARGADRRARRATLSGTSDSVSAI
jgi:hypothetical protein